MSQFNLYLQHRKLAVLLSVLPYMAMKIYIVSTHCGSLVIACIRV